MCYISIPIVEKHSFISTIRAEDLETVLFYCCGNVYMCFISTIRAEDLETAALGGRPRPFGASSLRSALRILKRVAISSPLNGTKASSLRSALRILKRAVQNPHRLSRSDASSLRSALRILKLLELATPQAYPDASSLRSALRILKQVACEVSRYHIIALHLYDPR